MTTITLKEILTDDNLKAFFKHSSDFFSHYPKSHLHFTLPKEIWNFPILKREELLMLQK